MKKLILLLLLLLIVPNKVLASSGSGFIDVKIGKTYEVFEKLNISCDTNLALFQKDDLENEMLVFDGYKIYVGKTFGVDNKIDIYDSDNQYITSIPSNGSVFIGPRFGYESTIKVGEKQYRGYISFIDDNTGLKAINHVEVEQYLRGVVPKEMTATFPMEALKAQAVAARTYAYSSLAKHSREGFNLCDTTHCQAYGGFDIEHILTDEAIIQTNNMVAKFKGAYASTVFHSSSGGFTESSESIWGSKNPYLIGKEDVYSLNTNHSDWTVEIDKDLLSGILKENGYEISRVNDIQILETHISGRVKEICINENKEKLILTGDKFRSLVGTTKLKSTLFKIDGQTSVNKKDVYIKGSGTVSPIVNMQIISDKNTLSKNNSKYSIIGQNNEIRTVDNGSVNYASNNITLTGRGYGHGVGMSQYGAVEMAKQGYNYIDILNYYYSGIEIIKIN
jgi:stage II sporulation protein D